MKAGKRPAPVLAFARRGLKPTPKQDPRSWVAKMETLQRVDPRLVRELEAVMDLPLVPVRAGGNF